MKNFLLGFVLGLILAFLTHEAIGSQIDPGGCALIGSVVGQIAENRASGTSSSKLLSSVVADVKAFKELPEDLQELLKLSTMAVIRSDPRVTPKDQIEGFIKFCHSQGGDVGEMVKSLKEYLKVKEHVVQNKGTTDSLRKSGQDKTV